MKGSIISPLWFYLIDLLENLGATLAFVTFVLFVVSLVFFITSGIVYLNAYHEDDKIEAKAIFQKGKKPLIIALISTILCCTIPSKETMYTMMVANYVTYENVDGAKEVIQDSVDYIMDKLDVDKEE